MVQGTRDELMEKAGFYYTLYIISQFTGKAPGGEKRPPRTQPTKMTQVGHVSDVARIATYEGEQR